ncbi:DUF5666 domain-containing protein [Vibrio rumoiensis]|uniref:DUF5666 domain-containing protein n=1 Tax=Vibrio rumoiensis 1S-45 TaxID=1188252 RepID=A0A1E5E6S3_9VIBR|nr:DUF5666 domain-containing protein [Vibrio rumoiensis]OEF30217.1 hypothetical protein A1QC_00100 [Vibrio rumoiensis 1S-45]
MKKTLLCVSIAALLSACGGGGGGDASTDNGNNNGGNTVTTPTQLNGVATSVTSTKITIGGYSLDAQNAKVTYNGQAMTLQDIQSGMRIEVDTNGQGQAESIELDPSLLGPITAVSDDTITVNGTTLSSSTSSVQGYAASSYQVGDWVFVNGYITASGQWQVEGVFEVDPMFEAEIEGTASQVTATSFFIGSTEIDYSTAQLEDGNPVDGDWVEVEGNLNQAGVFVATEVEVENDDQFDDVELEGTISWVNHDQSLIELNGRTKIAINSSTRFEDGQQSDLAEGKQVDVDLNSTETGLVALEVEFEGNSSNSSNNTKFALAGTSTYVDATHFTINGQSFLVDSRTEFDDRLTMNTINNANIEVEGVESKDAAGNTSYLVKEIEAVDANENEIDLEGTIQNSDIWGYQATDGSLDSFTNGSHVDVECTIVTLNTQVSNCRIDD